MKYSRQREMILECVNSSMDHPTADTIYARVRAMDPKVSLGTVYRNLNLLSEMGQLRKVAVPGNSERFDHTLEDHAHAVCTQCGAVIDVMTGNLPELLQSMSDDSGYSISRREVVLVGLCPDCQKANAN